MEIDLKIGIILSNEPPEIKCEIIIPFILNTDYSITELKILFKTLNKSLNFAEPYLYKYGFNKKLFTLGQNLRDKTFLTEDNLIIYAKISCDKQYKDKIEAYKTKHPNSNYLPLLGKTLLELV